MGRDMDLVQAIQRQGFRKWYERELLVSHLHLVLLLLCTVALLGALEVFSQPGANKLLMLASVALATVIGLWALRRYFVLLMRAERLGNQAVCVACGVYGRWAVQEQVAADEAMGQPMQMKVRCRACGVQWTIEC